MSELEIALFVMLGISFAVNVLQYALARQMVTPDVARLLASNIPPEVIERNSEALQQYLLNDGKKWNDIFAYIIDTASNTVINEVEDVQATE